MKHARPDYNRIQDPSHIIPEDEPVFLLRGQDIAAPDTVNWWATLVENLPGHNHEIADMARSQAKAMKEWQKIHGMKVPDLP